MLKGDKVVLRSVRPADLERYAEFLNDVETELLAGGQPPRPLPLGEVQNRYQASLGKTNEAWFAIDVAGLFIGQAILHEFDMTAHTVELGISIGDKDYWGRGFGRDAVNQLLKYAFRLRNMRRVWLRTTETNERALRCYRACGFVEEGRLRKHTWTDNRFEDEVLMGIFRAEWEARVIRDDAGDPAPDPARQGT